MSDLTLTKSALASLTKAVGADGVERVRAIAHAFDESRVGFAWSVAMMAIGALELSRIHAEIDPRPGRGHTERGDRWRAVLEALDISPKTASIRIRVAKELRSRLRKQGIDAEFLDRPLATLTAEDREKLQASVRKFTDGNTFRALAESFGILKAAPAGGGGQDRGDGDSDGPDDESSASENASILVGLPLFEWAHTVELPHTLDLLRAMPLEDDPATNAPGLRSMIKRAEDALKTLKAIAKERRVL